VKSNLPPNQILQLVKSGVLKIEGDDLRSLEQAVTAQAFKKDFESAASVFNSLAVVFNTVGIDDEVVEVTQQFAGLLTTGGAFAAAVTLGEPLSTFNTGAALLGFIRVLLWEEGRRQQPEDAGCDLSRTQDTQ
jgi:hypothetical protein